MIQSDLGKAEETERAIYVGMYLGNTDVVSICICVYLCRGVQNSYICGYALDIIYSSQRIVSGSHATSVSILASRDV